MLELPGRLGDAPVLMYTMFGIHEAIFAPRPTTAESVKTSTCKMFPHLIRHQLKRIMGRWRRTDFQGEE